MMRYVLALDFGASSGRAMLAGFDGSRITLQEVHRFANEPVSKDGRLYWNVPQLMEELEQGLQAGYAIAPYESIAIDTWGVDYGMLGADGTLLELPRHYRDGRTDGILQKAEQLLPAAELYRRTGTQVMEINTLFQLLCQRDSGGFDQCATILPMPDLFAYLLTGTISAERSIASTAQMLAIERSAEMVPVSRTLYRQHCSDALRGNRHMGSGTAGAFPHSPPDSAGNCGKRHGKRHAFSGSTAAAGLAGDSCDGGLWA